MPAVPPALVDVTAFYAAFDFTIDLCRAALSGLGGAGVEEQEGGGEEEEFFHAGFLWLDGRGGSKVLKHQVNRFRTICTVCGFVALS